MTDFDIDAMKRDMERPRLTTGWRVFSDVPAPGWVQVVGPAFKVAGPTTATDLNGEDYMDRHRDARRIARVPAMEAEILRLRAEVDAGLIREKDANARAMQHLRRAEKAEIASRNHVKFSYEWRERAEKAEAECDSLEAKLAERVTVVKPLAEAMEDLLGEARGVLPESADAFYDYKRGEFTEARILSAIAEANGREGGE